MNPQLQQLRTDLNSLFPERSSVITGSLAAVLAGEHVLLLGPPGTAKSALVRSIAQAFGGTYFEWLLSRFTVSEEIYGPLNLAALERGEFVRVTTGKLPEANFVFLDEVGRAGSSILNTLLAAMADRIFHNGTSPTALPLISVFGASNSVLIEPEQHAFVDRFLISFEVQSLLRPSNLRAVLTAPEPKSSVTLDMVTLKKMQSDAAAVRVTDDTVEALIQIREALQADGVFASDRKWKRSLKLVQSSAYLTGAKETSPEDLAILADVLWRDPKEKPRISRAVGQLSDPTAFKATEILDAARETAAKVHAIKNTDRKQYLSQASTALEEFRGQQSKLGELAKSGGRRAKEVISDATAEVNGLHAELARAISSGLGLGMRAVK